MYWKELEDFWDLDTPFCRRQSQMRCCSSPSGLKFRVYETYFGAALWVSPLWLWDSSYVLSWRNQKRRRERLICPLQGDSSEEPHDPVQHVVQSGLPCHLLRTIWQLHVLAGKCIQLGQPHCSSACASLLSVLIPASSPTSRQMRSSVLMPPLLLKEHIAHTAATHFLTKPSFGKMNFWAQGYLLSSVAFTKDANCKPRERRRLILVRQAALFWWMKGVLLSPEVSTGGGTFFTWF